MTRSERRQRTRLVAFRLLPAEHAAIQAAAKREGMSMSALIREYVLVRLEEPA